MIAAACQLCCKCYIWFLVNFAISAQPLIVLASDSSHVPGPAAAAVTTHRGELWRFGSQLWEGGQEYAGTATPREAGKVGGNTFFGCLGSKVPMMEVMQNGNLVLFLQLFSCWQEWTRSIVFLEETMDGFHHSLWKSLLYVHEFRFPLAAAGWSEMSLSKSWCGRRVSSSSGGIFRIR